MDKREKRIIVRDLEDRLFEILPEWQEKAILEAIITLEDDKASEYDIYTKLQMTQYQDLAALFILFMSEKRRYL